MGAALSQPSIDGKEAEIEVRQFFELEDFAPG